MKKGTKQIIFLSLLLITSLTLVSAQSATSGFLDDVRDFGSDLVTGLLEPVFKIFVGDYAATSKPGDFLMRVLFLIIVFALLYVAFDRIEFLSENAFVHWLLSGAVAILAIRWLANQALIQTILLPYSVLGVTVSAGLPFILFALIVKDLDSATLRRISWVFFAVVFFALWIARVDDIAKVAGSGFIPYIYLITAGLALLMILFDGTIEKLRHRVKQEKFDRITELETKADLVNQLKDLREKLTNNIISDDEFKKLYKQLRSKAKTLGLKHTIPKNPALRI